MDLIKDLSEAEQAHSDAVAAIDAARAAFDASGRDADLAALEKAKQNASITQERLARAERLRAEHEVSDVAERRAALSAERAAIERQLDSEGLARASAALDEREIAARLALADLATQRADLCQRTRELVFRSAALARELGVSESVPADRRANNLRVSIMARRPVELALEKAMSGASPDRRDAIRDVRP
jgi:hypothetical protein